MASHVVVFDHSTDATMTSYLSNERFVDGGTYRVIPIYGTAATR